MPPTPRAFSFYSAALLDKFGIVYKKAVLVSKSAFEKFVSAKVQRTSICYLSVKTVLIMTT